MQPTRLFHKDFPFGELFTSKKEHDEALKEGWVDAHHKVFEETELPDLPEYACMVPGCDYGADGSGTKRGLMTHTRMKHPEED